MRDAKRGWRRRPAHRWAFQHRLRVCRSAPPLQGSGSTESAGEHFPCRRPGAGSSESAGVGPSAGVRELGGGACLPCRCAGAGSSQSAGACPPAVVRELEAPSGKRGTPPLQVSGSGEHRAGGGVRLPYRGLGAGSTESAGARPSAALRERGVPRGSRTVPEQLQHSPEPRPPRHVSSIPSLRAPPSRVASPGRTHALVACCTFRGLPSPASAPVVRLHLLPSVR